MKVKGDRRNTGIGGVLVEGEPAWFAIKLGSESRFEMPIDPVSWEENFEIGEDGMMDAEDTPGFTLVAASAAIGMAMFINQRRYEEADE